jgi:4-cresol dehydrogenase (hydroxylating)
LERGYGITPYADHFGAVMAIEAVLPGGEVYRSALADLGSPEADRTFKWGIGPYLDGIFTQGNFGVVTQMTVALAKVPEKTQAFFFWVKQDAQLEAAVAAIRAIISSVGGSLGSINLMNTQRVLSMMIPYPREHVPSGSVMSAALVAEMARRHRVPAWTGVGSLYGPRRIVAACRPEIRKRLRGIAAPLIFLTPTLVHRARNLLAYVPGSQNFRLATLLRTLDRTLQLMAGAPSQIALPLAYWKSGTIPPNDQPMDPACDGCGLLWYSPLVPMKPERVRAYVEFVRELTTQNGIEPLITLTSLSDRCFDSTVPLLFDRGLPEETARAHQCYLDLFRRGQQKGFLPYRVGVDHMRLIVDPNKPFWGLARKIKDAVDPQGIIAPGRYSATTGTQETLTP